MKMRTITQITLGFMTLLLSVLLSEAAEAATYYVATTGSDTTGNGSIGLPWQSVPKGIRSLHAGDTLYIRGGTYTWSGIYGNAASDTYGCNPTCPTSWAGATKIMNYPGEAVVLTTHGFNMDNANYTNGVSYLIWQGDARSNLIIQMNGTGGDFSGFRLNNALHHIRLSTLTIRNYTGVGILGGNSNQCTSKPTFVEILNSEIRNNGDGLSGGVPIGAAEHGIYPSCGDSWTISGNYVVGNYAYGIHLNSSNALDNTTAITNFIVSKNIVEGRKTPLTSETSGGIVVTSGYGHVISNNVIIGRGSQQAKLTEGIGAAWRVKGASIYNNTIYDTAQFGIETINSSNIEIRNNILNLVPSDNVRLIGSTNVNSSNNLCRIADPGCSVVTSSPSFRLAGSNFRLVAGSPAIDAGTAILTVADDHDGLPRPLGSAYDIGAYEANNTPAPSPPKNLSVR
jgi:hypothetical protein